LADGGKLVAPLREGDSEQTLTLFSKRDGELRQRRLGQVLYVPDRSAPLARTLPTS
jgi:protein-L-isoaspartate O-methyltransferase